MILEKIKKAQVGEVIWDKLEKNSVKGLHLKVLPSGRKVFYFHYRIHGIERRPMVGDFPTLTLILARVLTRGWAFQVANGEDPSYQKQKLRADMTVAELFTLVWEKHWRHRGSIVTGYSQEVRRVFNRSILPRLGKLKLSLVSKEIVEHWHQAMVATPYSANRALSVLRYMFDQAPDHTNPCEGVKRFKETSRSRFATETELRSLGYALKRYQSENPRAVAFLYLLLFTGARPSFLERAEWKDLRHFDEYGVLCLQGKGKEERVFLPPQAMEIINGLPMVHDKIFGIKMPRRLWAEIKKEVGCKDLWARDARRTFATVGLSDGQDLNVIAELLNHHSTQTTKIYAKLMDNARVAAVTEIADRMQELLGV